MTGPEFETLGVSLRDGVATFTLDSPPLNLFGPAMQRDLNRALDVVENAAVQVVVVESATSGYFVAHYDLEEILAEDTSEVRTSPGDFNRLMGRLHAGRFVTIAKIRGAARGGGCELALACDLRFAAREQAQFAFPKVALGILPAGGGTQRLPGLIGRARALEMLLGCQDLDADEAERYGLVNRAVPDSELDDFVSGLAGAIAAAPPDAIAMTKLAVSHAVGDPEWSALALEALMLDLLKAAPPGRARMRAFLELGAQTEAGEAELPALLRRLAERDP